MRGNNSLRARDLLYNDVGVKKAYLVSYTPPIGIIGDDKEPRGCMFGVDMPPDPPAGEEFVARGRSTEEISERMGMPVVYLSNDLMLEAFRRAGIDDRHLCTYCIGGRHPLRHLESQVLQEPTPQLELLKI